MKDYLANTNTGDRTGKCPICEINLYGSTKTVVGDQTVIGTPVVMPCRIRGKDAVPGQKIDKGNTIKPIKYNCPFEEATPVDVERDFTLRLSGGNEGDF